MEITDNIIDSVIYPISDIKNLAIFVLLLLSCILIVTIPLVSGYIYRIIKETSEGYDTLPEFDDLGQMYIDGLKYLGAGIIYGVITGIIMILLLTIGVISGSHALSIFMGIICILLLLILFGWGYGAVFNMINEDEFGAAFDFSKILAIIESIGIGQYIIWIIAIIVISIILSVVGNLLSWTIIIPAIVNAWLYCFQGRSLALIFAYE